MSPKHRDKLKQICHDRVISFETSQACGKLIPNINDVANCYRILEQILGELHCSGTIK